MFYEQTRSLHSVRKKKLKFPFALSFLNFELFWNWDVTRFLSLKRSLLSTMSVVRYNVNNPVLFKEARCYYFDDGLECWRWNGNESFSRTPRGKIIDARMFMSVLEFRREWHGSVWGFVLILCIRFDLNLGWSSLEVTDIFCNNSIGNVWYPNPYCDCVVDYRPFWTRWDH